MGNYGYKFDPAAANSVAGIGTPLKPSAQALTLGAFRISGPSIYDRPESGTLGWPHLGAVVPTCFRSVTRIGTRLADLNLAEDLAMSNVIPFPNLSDRVDQSSECQGYLDAVCELIVSRYDDVKIQKVITLGIWRMKESLAGVSNEALN